MKEITANEFDQEVLNGGKVIVDFYSTECPPCEALFPKLNALDELYGDDVKIIKIFRQGNRDLAEKYNVSGSPTILFFEGGKQKDRVLSGGVKRSEIETEIQKMLPAERVEEIKAKQEKSITETDVVIVGGGPAGLTAAIYLGQAKIDTIIVDTKLPGGQVSTSHQISNFPGHIEPVAGFMLSHYMSEQAINTGIKTRFAVDITNVDLKNKTVEIDGVETIKAKKIVLSTGASPRYLNIQGEKEYKGQGVSYCATCDAKYNEGKDVVVIGGGNTAVEESDFISKFAKKITMVHQFDTLTSNKEAQEKIFNNEKISIEFNSEPRAIRKENGKMLVDIENLNTKEKTTLKSDSIFVFVGMQPNVDNLDSNLAKDDWGYLKVNEDMETNIPDIYAVGDVISKKYRQITTAVADGTIAAIAISKILG